MPMPDFADVHMRFLPSEHGNGYVATIRADLGFHPQGWKQWYAHLKGKAERAPYCSKWAAIVEERLEKQGVRFV